MRKKIFALILSASLVAKMSAPFSVRASDLNAGDPDNPAGAVMQSAKESGSLGENLTWELSEDGTLTIGGSGPMEEFEHDYKDGNPIRSWDAYLDEIHKVVIEDWGNKYCSLGIFQGSKYQ